MTTQTRVKPSPKPASGKKKTSDKKDERYATEQILEYYNGR